MLCIGENTFISTSKCQTQSNWGVGEGVRNRSALVILHIIETERESVLEE